MKIYSFNPPLFIIFRVKKLSASFLLVTIFLSVFTFSAFGRQSLFGTSTVETAKSVPCEFYEQNREINNYIESKSVSNSAVIKIQPSKITELAARKKSENPNLTAKQLADYATGLIPLYGVNFGIDLSGLIRRKIKARKVKKLHDENVRFDFQMTLNDSSKKIFQIDAPVEGCCCGLAYADFPVTEITAKYMTVIAGGKPYRIKRTSDVSFTQSNTLVEGKTKSKQIRVWQVPGEAAPHGISADGTKLYIYYDNDLMLEISETGKLKFVSPDDPNIISDGTDWVAEKKYIDPNGKGLMNFKSKNKNYFVKFEYVCS